MVTTVTTTDTTRTVGHQAHGAAHEHGAMDARPQQRTFDGFVKFITWSAIASIAILIFMALANS